MANDFCQEMTLNPPESGAWYSGYVSLYVPVYEILGIEFKPLEARMESFRKRLDAALQSHSKYPKLP